MKKLLFSLLTLQLIFAPFGTFAADFDPEHILSDTDLTNYKSMSLDDIQSFLERQNSYLANYIAPDITGIPKSASQIIFEASRNYLINPKYILTLLQKEQSLITRSQPTQRALDWATGYAVCDSCSKEDPKVQRFQGFGKQVDRATWLTRYYLAHPHEANYYVSTTHTIDGKPVVPKNTATAVLYTYTPHFHGNENLWKIWQGWFAKAYPDGSLLKSEKTGEIWFIQNELRRPIASLGVLMSRFDVDHVITASHDDIQSYDQGTPIKYHQYALLESPNGDVYLYVDDTLRLIESDEVFRTLGFNPEEIEVIETFEELNEYPLGEPITIESSYPTGALLQHNKTGGVYYVQDGVKFPIWAKELMVQNYPQFSIFPVGEEILDQFETGKPVKFKDGNLIALDEESPVYVISNGQKRQIVSDQDFVDLGYDEENIIYTSQKVLDIHETGTPISTQKIDTVDKPIQTATIK